MARRRARVGAVAVCLALVLTARTGLALRSDEAAATAESMVRRVEASVGAIRAEAARVAPRPTTPERRIAEGELHLRNQDYERAIQIFSQVDELFRQGNVPASAHADALFLLGESYFRSDQLLSARRRYLEILDGIRQRAYAPYAGRALSRLVDIALRTEDPAAVDALAARLAELPDADATGSLQYARGKLAFARRDYVTARRELAGVPANVPFTHQSQYLLGVVFTKEALVQPAAEPGAGAEGGAAQPGSIVRFAAAVDQFRRVTRLPADTREHRHVVDLAWMAIGRLCYESDSYLDAADAYSHVGRQSPEFSTMLYELAWVYVRLGDHQRAQRALEVLAVTDPDRLDLADGALLRADLRLRAGEFEQALAIYRGVRERFDPIRRRVAEFLAATTDPVAYYDQVLNDAALTPTGRPTLPPIVLGWARQEAEDANAFALIDDVNRSRALLGDARLLARRLRAVLSTTSRVKAFPELQSALEKVLAPLNQLSHARRILALGMDDVAGRAVGSGVTTPRAARRALMSRVGQMPASEGDFQRREESGKRQWDQLSQALQRLQLQADSLQALVNGLKRVVEEPRELGLSLDPATLSRYRAEIEANERAVAALHGRIAEYREAVESGKVQIGFGDQRYVDDEQVRRQFAAALAEEVTRVAAGEEDERARDYARSIQPLLDRIGRAEGQLLPIRALLLGEAERRGEEMMAAVAREVANLERSGADLDTLDHEARALVGEVAKQSFVLVGERLKSIVLRADVGIVQQAWEVREAARLRVRNLRRERSLEDRKLDDELREVLDEAEESP